MVWDVVSIALIVLAPAAVAAAVIARRRNCVRAASARPTVESGPSALDRNLEIAARETLARADRQLQASGLVTQLASLAAGDVPLTARGVTEIATDVVECERANVWLFNEDETELRCIDCFERTPRQHTSGGVLHEPDFRNEFEALKKARYVDANDPLTDPRTAGYVEPYLRVHGITSMLDVVVRVAGRNMGLLCLEHVGREHRWEPDEIAFACQLADKIGLAIVTRNRLESEQRARESEAALAEAQAIAHVGSWEFDVPRNVLVWSAETFRMFGLDAAAFVPTCDSVLARTAPDDQLLVADVRRQALARCGDYQIDYRIVLDDGSVRHVHETGRSFPGPDGAPVRLLGAVQDTTEHKLAEDRLIFANTLFRTEMETSPDGILVVDDRGRVLSFNRRFAEMWNLSADLRAGADDQPILAAVTSQVKNAAAFRARVEHFYRSREEKGRDEIETLDGRFFDRYTAALRSPSAQYLGRIWFFRDITDRKRAEAEIRHSAAHDGLTGLANRAVFTNAVAQATARVRRFGGSFALLSLDLDHFKDVNDTLGHPAGDLLLQEVGARLRRTCRDTDLIARFGGDEFAVIASDLRDASDAAVLAGAIIEALSEPVVLDGNHVRTGGTIGIAVYAGEETAPEIMLSHADLALYRAKSEARGTYCFFTEAMDQDVHDRVTLAAGLRDALTAGELFLRYQPQIDIRTGAVTGVEALVRWRHPTRGVLQPAFFVPIAERSGQIAALSRWVLRESCREARAWMDAGVPIRSVAVNLSASQFKIPFELEFDIAHALAETGLPAECLEVEITESAMLVASREEHDGLARIRALGVRLALDDFGTGYSSLDYLRRFPVDRIKIPHRFIAEIADGKNGGAIVKAIIGLARELGLGVIAEGVEAPNQVELLQSWGCFDLQGFLFSTPLSPQALRTFAHSPQLGAGSQAVA